MVHQEGAAQAEVAFNRQSIMVEGGNHKAARASESQEPTACRSAVGAHTGLQMGRGTPREEDGYHATNSRTGRRALFSKTDGGLRIQQRRHPTS
jgi:hypothetical protein